MQTEIHCVCGDSRPIAPGDLKPEHRCKRCGAALRMYSNGGRESVRWLMVRQRGAAPSLAVAIPVGVPLKVGRDASCWLRLDSDKIAPVQVELRLSGERTLAVRHVDGIEGTWINRAKISTGVVHEQDVLRIADREFLPAAHAAVIAGCRADAGKVAIVEDEESDEVEPARVATAESAADEGNEPASKGRRVWLGVCIVVLVGSVFSLSRGVWSSSIPIEIGNDTEYQCPVDGTIFRAAWSKQPPACPQCGQKCLGLLKYHKYKLPAQTTRPTTSRPTTNPDGPRAGK